jgi:pectinesterase
LIRLPFAFSKGIPMLEIIWLLLLLPFTLLHAQEKTPKNTSYSAIVDTHHSGQDGAVINDTPTYKTIGAALVAAPDNNASPHIIFIRAGRYYEKLSIDKPNIHLIGENRETTTITYDAAAGTHDPQGKPYGTRGSFTLRISAPDFRAENLTIENSFDYHANRAKADDDPTKLRDSQAVALLTDQNSDRATFINCTLTSHQDTLFANIGRHYFYKSIIAGSVDFIFGAGQVVFDDCDIISRDRYATNNGYIVAPSTLLAQPFGFLFTHCRLKKETPEMNAGSVSLGRPWHPSGNPQAVGSSIFMHCEIDDHISEQGWVAMGGGKDKNGNRILFQPENARFFEYNNTGPGAITSPSRRTLTDIQAQAYTIHSVLNGWQPHK